MPKYITNLEISSNISNWVNSLRAKGLQTSTLSKYIKIVQKFLKHCLYKGYLSEFPVMRGVILRSAKLPKLIKDE